MKQTERKPWVRWLYLASSVIWLVNLAVRLSNYFQRLGRGVPPEQLADARFDCVSAAFIAVIWLAGFFLWRLDRQKPLHWFISAAVLAAVTAAWAACYPLMAGSSFPPFFWWLITTVAIAGAIHCLLKSWSVKRRTKSHIEDEMI